MFLALTIPQNFFGSGKVQNPSALIPIAIAVIAAVLLALVIGWLRRRRGGPASGTDAGVPQVSQSVRHSFKRRIGSLGLSKVQADFLDEIVLRYGLKDPETLLADSRKLDEVFKKAYQDIEKTSETEEAAEARKATLLSVRQLLEAVQAGGSRVLSTRQLASGQEFSFITEDDSNYPSRIVGVDEQAIYAELPLDGLGRPIELKRGDSIDCFFYERGGVGHNFSAKVRGIEKRRDRKVLSISHSDSMKELPYRKHVRKKIQLSCVYCRVRLEDATVNGRKTQRLIPDNRRFIGTINDVSAGGCSMRAAVPLKKGEYMRIEFDVEKESEAAVAVGAVRKVSPLARMGAIMHIQFTKMSQKALNVILSRVYGY